MVALVAVQYVVFVSTKNMAVCSYLLGYPNSKKKFCPIMVLEKSASLPAIARKQKLPPSASLMSADSTVCERAAGDANNDNTVAPLAPLLMKKMSEPDQVR